MGNLPSLQWNWKAEGEPKMRNPSKKTIKHMAKIVLFQNDSYNPIIRDIRKWENMNPKLARRERWRFYYAYFNIVWNKSKKTIKENDIYE